MLVAANGEKERRRVIRIAREEVDLIEGISLKTFNIKSIWP
jgi:hypothetical protein